LALTGRIFLKFDIGVFRKFVDKIQVYLIFVLFLFVICVVLFVTCVVLFVICVVFCYSCCFVVNCDVLCTVYV
jgi:hypothetical protein